MEYYLTRILLIVGSYLLGAIPFGLITARVMGAGDIRKVGSGNIGATNVLRNVGKSGGIITLLFDSMKGVIPVLVARSLWGIDIWTLAVAFVAITGHNYPVYLKFKGGKGVATSLGVLVALWPYTGIITLGIWLASVIIWRYSSLGALISFAMLPIVIYLREGSVPYFIFSFLISLMIFYRHIENIKRLISGKEKKIGKGGSSSLLLLILILFSVYRIADAGIVVDTPSIPHEVQSLWDAQRSSLSKGDRATGEVLLSAIVETKYRLGIDRIDDVSALLVREGYQALEKGMVEDAYKLSNKAKEISPYYAPPYYLSARCLLRMSNIMAAVTEYVSGLKTSLRDFWTLFNIIGRLYTTVIIAITLTSLTFLIVWLSRLMPVFLHTFRETTTGLIDRPLRPIFFGAIIVLPLVFGIGWFVLFWIVGVWIYLVRKERIIALLIVAFFLLLPQILKFNTVYIMKGRNVTLQGLLAVERGYGDPGMIERLKDQYKNKPGDTYLPLGIAYLLYKQGDVEGSVNYYHKLLNIDKKHISLMALNDLGNLYFKAGDYDNAIVYYRKAINDFPDSAISAYNLSQTYREKLMFAEAESAYNSAKKLSPEDVGRYTDLATRGNGYKVIDFPVSKSDLWAAALRPTEDSEMLATGILRGVFRIPADRLPFLALSIFIILTILSYLRPRTPMAYYCPKCGRTVCGWCTGSKIFGGRCKECRGKDEKIEGATGPDRRISFILPGIWHMYKGMAGSGGLISLIFFFGLSGLILGEIDDTWYLAYYLPDRSYIPWLFLITLSYILITFQFKYIKIRFNT